MFIHTCVYKVLEIIKPFIKLNTKFKPSTFKIKDPCFTQNNYNSYIKQLQC